MRKTTITVTGAVGSAGAATASAISDEVVEGFIRAVHIAYTDTPPATADVAIVEANESPAMPILTVLNANTDGWFFPMAQAQDPDGVDITNQGAPIPVADTVKATLTGANAGDGCVVTIVWEPVR